MNTEINKIREEIDEIDRSIVKLIEKRMSLSRKVGSIKKGENYKIKDKSREEEIISTRTKDTILSEEFTKELFTKIIEESRRVQSL